MQKQTDAFSYPTIAELLRLPVFTGCRVLSGEENLSRCVVGVNATDVPDYYNWVAEGELLVSSCYSLLGNEDEQKRFIARLAERGLAGACIKSARFFGGVPENILREAQRLHFPLIEIAPDVRFADLSRAVAEEFSRRRMAVLNSALSVNQLLTRMITVGASLDEIAETVAGISGSSVLIVDDVNRRRGSFSPNGEELSEEEVREGDVCHEICIEDYHVGKLCLWGGHTPLREEVLSQILHVIPLEISRSHAVRESENSNFADFFFHLLSDRITDEQQELERARAFGMDLSRAHVLLRVRFGHSQELSGYGFFFRKALFLRQLRGRLEELGLHVQTIQGEVDTLLLLTLQSVGGELSALLPRLEESVCRLFDDHRELEIAVGCSRAHSELAGLPICASESGLALRTAAAIGGRNFLQFDNLGILRLLYANDPQQESGLFVTEVLKDLVTAPDEQNRELLETLESFFRCLGNRREMARELYVHYNTVSHRLQRIEELTHMSLAVSEDRLQLQLALYLHKFRSSADRQKREG